MYARLVAVIAIGAIVVACVGGAVSPTPGATLVASAPASSAASIPSAIVGSWTTTITEDDLRAAGQAGEGNVAENTGTFTMTLGGDGTWSTAQVSDVPVRWPVFRGTMVATGPSSFRQTTTFPTDFAGDVVDFTWSIEDNALRIKVVTPPDPLLPVVMETHPWQPKE
jgi:hypothetical protein